MDQFATRPVITLVQFHRQPTASCKHLVMPRSNPKDKYNDIPIHNHTAHPLPFLFTCKYTIHGNHSQTYACRSTPITAYNPHHNTHFPVSLGYVLHLSSPRCCASVMLVPLCFLRRVGTYPHLSAYTPSIIHKFILISQLGENPTTDKHAAYLLPPRLSLFLPAP